MVVLRTGPVTVGGVTLDNHLLLAAGVLGTTGASLSRMLARGAGGVVTKSIGPQPKDGHPGPCVALLDNGILNAMGLPNPSREFTEELPALENKPVIVSIFGGNPAEFAEVAGWFKGMAAGVELNLSPPCRRLRSGNRRRSCSRRGMYSCSERTRDANVGKAHP